MKNVALWIAKKFLSPSAVADLLAKIVANLLRKASRSKNWDLFRKVVERVEAACRLFNACYEDDSMDEKDEERIAKAIEQLADGVDVDALLNKK